MTKRAISNWTWSTKQKIGCNDCLLKVCYLNSGGLIEPIIVLVKELTKSVFFIRLNSFTVKCFLRKITKLIVKLPIGLEINS